MRRLVTVSLLMVVWFSNGWTEQVPTADVYQAKMVVTITENSSVANLWAKPGLIRVNSSSGRAFNSSITDYRQKKSWAISSAHRVYQEFSSKQLRSYVPEFFNPELKIEKEFIDADEIDGIAARKYSAKICKTGSSAINGFLWEAVDLPGYPLQWEDPVHNVHAIWKNAQLVSKPDNFFQVPADYREQKAKPPQPKKVEGCNKPGKKT